MGRKCARCEALERRLLELETQLGYRAATSSIRVLKDSFNVTPVQARLLWRLYSAGGAAVPREALMEELDAANAENLKALFSQIRRSNDVPPFEAIRGIGYAMTPEALETATAALNASRSPAPLNEVDRTELDDLAERIAEKIMDAGAVLRRRARKAP